MAVADASLLDAVTAGRVDVVAQRLAAGADPKQVDTRGLAPLHLAAAGGSSLITAVIALADVDLAILEPTDAPFAAIATALLDAGADPNHPVGPAGITPLMIATYFGLRDVAELLRARGADPDLRDGLGRTPERFAEFPSIARLIRLCRRLEMVKAAYIAQIHAPVTHQFTSPVVGLELTAPLPGDAFAAWPADEPVVAFGLGEDAVSRLIRLTPPAYARTVEHGPRGPFARTFTLHFEDARPPYELKFALEKQTEVLMPFERSTTTPLVFRGRRLFSGVPFDVTLVFETVRGSTRMYTLHTTASATRDVQSAAGFTELVDNVESSWRRKVSARDAEAPGARGEAYAAEVREAIELEAQAVASRREDAAMIRALQHEFLAAMDKGHTLSSGHKDGGSELRWRNGRGAAEEYDHRGECVSGREFTDPDEFLAYVRRSYAWDIDRETASSPPVESAAWRYLIDKLVR